ncbi:MAG TPA: histidine triad nucleotide-binding protein [Nocardioidaceae bacterium]
MSAQRDADCLFCKIVAGELPADIVHETETTVAFRDIEPQMPTHVLVIPRNHHRTAADLARDEPSTLVDVLNVAAAVAQKEGLADGYRLVFNTEKAAGQAVFHVHLHVLGGRVMHWPPG